MWDFFLASIFKIRISCTHNIYNILCLKKLRSAEFDILPKSRLQRGNLLFQALWQYLRRTWASKSYRIQGEATTAISKLFAAFKVIKMMSQFIYPKSTSDPLRGPRSRGGNEDELWFCQNMQQMIGHCQSLAKNYQISSKGLFLYAH